MRIAVAVVVGLVVLGSGYAHGAEAPRERSEACLDDCDFAFDECRRREGPKGPGRCNVEVVRCKQACPFVPVEEPAVPTAKSRQRCLDACRDVYERCRERPENKHGGRCAADEVRCEQACPDVPEPETAAATPPEAAAAAPSAAAPAPAADTAEPEASAEAPSTAPAVPVVAAPPAAAPPAVAPPAALAVEAPARRAARVQGAAPVAAAAGTPVTVEAPAPATIRSEASVPPASAPAAPPAAAVRPAQAERGFFAKLGCFFVSCEPAGPSPCVQQCLSEYDACTERESPKRSGECNARLMRCRQGCSDAAAAR